MSHYKGFWLENVGFLSISEINVLDKPDKKKLQLVQCPLASRGNIDSNPFPSAQGTYAVKRTIRTTSVENLWFSLGRRAQTDQ